MEAGLSIYDDVLFVLARRFSLNAHIQSIHSFLRNSIFHTAYIPNRRALVEVNLFYRQVYARSLPIAWKNLAPVL